MRRFPFSVWAAYFLIWVPFVSLILLQSRHIETLRWLHTLLIGLYEPVWQLIQRWSGSKQGYVYVASAFVLSVILTIGLWFCTRRLGSTGARRVAIALCVVILSTFILPIGQPWTVGGAVKRVQARLTDADREYILRNPPTGVATELHMSLGMGIRNEFGLWGRNWILTLSCGGLHPDECSGIILMALCEDIRRHANRDFVQNLDEQFQLIQKIKIDYRGFSKLRTGQLLAELQAQIDRQLQQDPTTAGKMLKLRIIGDPDPEGYVRAEFSEDGQGPVSLDALLGWISWRNSFSVRHDPPYLEFTFSQKRAWDKPF